MSAVEYGGYVYLFGAGNPYRKRAVWLARFRPRAIDRYKQWRFLGSRQADAAWLGAARERCQPVVAESRLAWANSQCVATRRAATS